MRKAICKITELYFRIDFISIISNKNSKMRQLKSLVLVLAAAAKADFWAMNPQCPDIDGKFRFDLTRTLLRLN